MTKMDRRDPELKRWAGAGPMLDLLGKNRGGVGGVNARRGSAAAHADRRVVRQGHQLQQPGVVPAAGSALGDFDEGARLDLADALLPGGLRRGS